MDALSINKRKKIMNAKIESGNHYEFGSYAHHLDALQILDKFTDDQIHDAATRASTKDVSIETLESAFCGLCAHIKTEIDRHERTYPKAALTTVVNRRKFLKKQITKQREWIERCENNGKSYADAVLLHDLKRGLKIKQADMDHLHHLEEELRKLA